MAQDPLAQSDNASPAPVPRARRELTADEYAQGVLGGDRALLGRAITLIESLHPAHQALAQEVLGRLLPHTGQAHRVGITGVPGVGKSTFIEALGCNLTKAGHRVAVLAVDPTSSVTGGSILGDKTRMHNLATDANAFIRPSPSAGTLGGVTRKTRETMLVCEAAGFDVILVETVGVGQSETVVADMVDFFLVLMLAGAGDELQGIKRGVLELAETIAINKADGDNLPRAKRAAHEYRNAIRFMRPTSPHWTTPVLVCSGLENRGLDELWECICDHRRRLTATGELAERRRRQMVRWMWAMIEEQLLVSLRHHPRVASLLSGIERDVLEGRVTPTLAAARILEAYDG
jgi:LAO/AO transport system kinase